MSLVDAVWVGGGEFGLAARLPSMLRMASQSSLTTACRWGKWPRALVALRNWCSSDLMLLVVQLADGGDEGREPCINHSQAVPQTLTGCGWRLPRSASRAV